ncbi:MAG: FtsX-like permease family protein [Cytophagales bacterium]|nr:FtsX-like permease family protein [Cytophagales bacterium]
MLKNFFVTSYRSLLRNKAYFFLGVIGLSLGIACVVTLYSIIRFQDRFDTHQANYDQIYRLVGSYQIGDQSGMTATVPHPLADGLREDLTNVEAISNVYMLNDQVNIPTNDGRLKKIKQRRIAFVQPDMYDILTFDWLAGSPDITDPDAVYLSASTAFKFFETNDYSSLLGRDINLANKHTLIVKGIYLDFPKSTDFPFEMVAGYEKQEGVNAYYGEGKLWGRLNGGTQCVLKINSGSDARVTQRDVNIAFEKHNQVEGFWLEVQALSDIHSGKVGNYSGVTFEPVYKIISYTLAILLALIGSINFINLTTARAIHRAKEVGIRKVMGGYRIDLIAQFLMETFLIVLIALGLGFILGEQFLMLFSSLINSTLSLADMPTVEWIAFAAVILVAMTLLSGLYPALILSKFSPVVAIKTRVSNIDQQSKLPIRKILVGLQFGFSVSLIIGAIVIFSQMRFMRDYDMGYQTDGIIQLLFPEPDLERQKRLKVRLESLPEVDQVSVHLGSPMANTNNTDRYFSPELGKDQDQQFNVKSIDENYLDLFELQLVSGRNLRSNDPSDNVLVTEQALKELELGSPTEALGKELHASGWDGKYRIVGVLKDFNSFSLQNELIPVMMRYEEDGFYEMALKLSSSAESSAALASIETIWDEVYPELLIEYNFFDQEIASRYQFEEVMAKGISFFVLIALVISILGLYGLTDYMANAKRKEVGIRKVLGATLQQILSIFAKEVTWLLIIAFIVSGSVTYFLMSQWLEGFEYRISLGWEIILSAFVITIIVSAITMGTRSFGAARLNPVDVLKDE